MTYRLLTRPLTLGELRISLRDQPTRERDNAALRERLADTDTTDETTTPTEETQTNG